MTITTTRMEPRWEEGEDVAFECFMVIIL